MCLKKGVLAILELGGVCPFCLISTTASTLIALAFVVDDARYAGPLLGKRVCTRINGRFTAQSLRKINSRLAKRFAFVCGM